MMDPIYEIELEDRPFCGGPGVMQEENGWCVYVECPDCGAHTAYTAFEGEDGRMQAAKTAAQLWHVGKVIGPGVGD